LLAPFFLNPIFAKNYIAGLDFFAGARMHSTIAAFSSGIAVFPMAYSRKFNGLFIDTLDYKYMGDMVNEEKEDILDGIKESFGKREELALIIQDRMNTIVKEREKLLVEHLTEVLGMK
jgi:colanic acid/amylovoran biosynthesis protein